MMNCLFVLLFLCLFLLIQNSASQSTMDESSLISSIEDVLLSDSYDEEQSLITENTISDVSNEKSHYLYLSLSQSDLSKVVQCTHRCSNYFFCLLRNGFNGPKCKNLVPLDSCPCDLMEESHAKTNPVAISAKARCYRQCANFVSCLNNPHSVKGNCNIDNCNCGKVLPISMIASKRRLPLEVKSKSDLVGVDDPLVESSCTMSCNSYWYCVDSLRTDCKVHPSSCKCIRIRLV
mmetsp:Transcript_8148/g.12094  ORF Transcript_8148/g.12094 Transcript_8148/m.12094 type:complete len:234 (+) Transcript_8148:104-805(+)